MNAKLWADKNKTIATEKDIENIVTQVYESPHLIQYPYHNLAHTQSVVAHCKEIAAWYLLNESDVFILTSAAWFHDIGHLYGEMKGHEERGVLIMEYYLQSSPPDLLTAIGKCIMATKFPSQPQSIYEQIICDADTWHFGTSLFRRTDVLVEQEMEMRTGKKDPHWHEASLRLLNQHVFFTDYCQHLLDAGKKENIAWLGSLIR
ncbi:MAG TPA: HD domain-containing protein [Puia sp.]|nr:HD domain-containing protein [Puia sp.]